MIVGNFNDIKANIRHNYEIVKHECIPEKLEELVFPMLNSYNKSVALTYYVGFVNSRHNVSVIFPENSINFKLKKNVSKDLMEQIAEQLAFSNGRYSIDKIEENFKKKIDKLKAADMAGIQFLSYFCKFFHITKQDIIIRGEQEEAIQKRDFFNERTAKYIKEYGQNAYSFLLGISDYITNFETRKIGDNILPMQIETGKWADNYLKESAKPDFDAYTYIGKEAFNTANWLSTLTMPKGQNIFE